MNYKQQTTNDKRQTTNDKPPLMFKFLKKDSYLLGTIMSIVIPVATWAIIHFTNKSLRNHVSGRSYLTEFMVEILALVPNVLLLRYYLINLKADKTGRAIVAVTFVIGLVMFILNLKDNSLGRLVDGY
jgi:hypothetical protein